jgi:hypothetical protein
VRAGLIPLRDATAATVLLLAAVWAGSGGFAHLDLALLGYLGATVVAAFGTVWRISTAWRRPAAAFYLRALWHRRAVPGAGRDLAAQGFIARRSWLRWSAHMLLSLGTLASFAITLPLVFGWMRFQAEGQSTYRILVASQPAGRFALDGPVAWLLFHALSLAAVAVVLGALYFLAVRWRARRLPGVATSFHLGPLLLLLAVALTGLALPATRGRPDLFPIAAAVHELTVIVLLVAMPFSKLSHLLIRPLQLGAQVVRRPEAERVACTGCGAPLAPAAQIDAVAALLRERGLGFQRVCPGCRRRQVAQTQAGLLGAHFQPPITGAAPRPPVRTRTERAA